jgi:hypothetical protein
MFAVMRTVRVPAALRLRHGYSRSQDGADLWTTSLTAWRQEPKRKDQQPYNEKEKELNLLSIKGYPTLLYVEAPKPES